MTKPDRNEDTRSLEELRLSLARKLADVLDGPSVCPDRRCRRARRCIGQDLICLDRTPHPPVDDEAGEAALAQLQAALRRQVVQPKAADGAKR